MRKRQQPAPIEFTFRVFFLSDQSEMTRIEKPESLREFGGDVHYYRYTKLPESTMKVLPELMQQEIPISTGDLNRLQSYRLCEINIQPKI